MYVYTYVVSGMAKYMYLQIVDSVVLLKFLYIHIHVCRSNVYCKGQPTRIG